MVNRGVSGEIMIWHTVRNAGWHFGVWSWQWISHVTSWHHIDISLYVDYIFPYGDQLAPHFNKMLNGGSRCKTVVYGGRSVHSKILKTGAVYYSILQQILIQVETPMKISICYYLIGCFMEGCRKTPHNIDCFLGSLCYLRAVFRLNCFTAQLSYEGRAAVEGAK
jgi:hypothetical protein